MLLFLVTQMVDRDYPQPAIYKPMVSSEQLARQLKRQMLLAGYFKCWDRFWFETWSPREVQHGICGEITAA